MLTPADIEQQQFGTTRLREGYDQDEVDTFLDRVGVDYRKLRADYEELNRLTQNSIRNLELELAAARRPVPQDADMPSLESIRMLLVAAQKSADQVQADADASAGRTVGAAIAEVDRIVGEARREADRVVGEAHTQRQQQIDDLDKRRRELSDEVNDLNQQRAMYREWLRGSLAKMEEADISG